MSSRRQRRAVKRAAQKKLDDISLRKRAVSKKAGEDVFRTMSLKKKFGPLTYMKEGLVIAPSTTLLLFEQYITFRTVQLNKKTIIESIVIKLFKRQLRIKNWTVRTDKKPKGSILKWIFTFRKS